MCGICGVFRPDGAVIAQDRIERIRDAMSFRGPDAAGATVGEGFGLGHRRLAIIDLSEAGCQPMRNEDGSIQIVLNGEIYNFQELRKPLVDAGHQFRSSSDTEVLIHGYEEWGLERLLRQLRGMYAFALIDRPRRIVHLARDPLGKKPLFFRWTGDELIFASSARALTLGTNGSPVVDPRAIDDLLANLYVPGPRTIFKDVEKVLPGHAVSFDSSGRRHDLVHWKPDFFHPEHGVSESVWLDRIEAALDTAVRRRLIADVPVGLLLSGGVDSSLVTAFAARAAGAVQTFSVAADQASLDESSYAQAVADHCRTNHRVLRVGGDVRRRLPRLIASLGEPMADASALNLIGISELARDSVTVALTGDGGDEGFGGYSTFWAYFHAASVRRFLPNAALPALAGVADVLRNAGGPIRRAGTLLRLAARPVEETYAGGAWLRAQLRRSLYTDGMAQQLAGHDPAAHYRLALASSNGASSTDRVMQAHLLTVLPDDYLAKVDSATMAVSLEARSPFLDQDLIELAMRIPLATRFSGGAPKALLRRLAYRFLPRHIIDRPKQGFVAPVGQWLRRDWIDLIEAVVLGPAVERRGWFTRSALERVVADHRRGHDRGYLLWTLLVLELWMQMAVDRTLTADAQL